MLERHHFVCKTFFFEAADESLLDGDAAMPANCAEPGANLVVVAPFEVVLAEVGALVADGVPEFVPDRRKRVGISGVFS